MIKVVRLLYQLSKNPHYRRCIEALSPDSARFDPGCDAVMMGYDFHLSAEGPKLVEVNTNAGGLWYASLCYRRAVETFPERLGGKLVKTFCDDYAAFCGAATRPLRIAIVDEAPDQQALFAEMQVFADLFERHGMATAIAAPDAIVAGDGGLYLHGQRIEMIYNRHCDFYMESPALAHLRAAYLQGRVCVSPNPRAYGLLADKRRMLLWRHPELLGDFGLSDAELKLLADTIPETRMLGAMPLEEVWKTRKQWVFKPGTGYASRGVYVGDKLTKNKLAELNPEDMLLQQRIPPSLTVGDDGQSFKTDYRLFVYKNRILCVAARIYQGQVTNLRTENGGFARVELE